MEYAGLFPGMVREIAGAALIILAALGCGRALLCRFGKAELPAMTALSTGMVVNALLGVFVPVSFLVVPLCAAAVYGAYRLFYEVKKFPWVYGIVFLCALPFAANALLPPWSWDEQVYQISLLDYYCRLDAFPVRPDNPYSAYPSLVHAFLLPGFAIGGATVPRLAALMVLAACCGKIYLLFARERWVTLAVLAALVASPLTLIIMRDFYVEPFILFFSIAGLSCLGQLEMTRREIAAAAVAAAACASVKLTGIGMALAIFAALLCRKESRKYWKLFILIGIVTALGFFLRVFWYTGNPFYPYFSFISGKASCAEVEKFHRILGGHYGIDPLFGSALGWLLSAWQKKVYDGIVTGFQFPLFFLTSLGGTYLAFRSRHEKSRMALCGCAVLLTGYLFWSLTARQSRFLLPVMWLAGVLALYIVKECAAPRMKKLFLLLCAATVIWSVADSFSQWKHHYFAWRILPQARRYPLDFASRLEHGYVYLARKLNQLPAGSRIAMLMERRTLYLKRDVTLLMPAFQERLTPLPEHREQLYEELKNFDYIVVRLPETDVDSAEEYVEMFSRLYTMVRELTDEGKLQYVPDCGQAILRVVP